MKLVTGDNIFGVDPDGSERQGRRPGAQRNSRAGQQAGDRLHQFQGRDSFVQDSGDAGDAGRHSRHARADWFKPTKEGRYQIYCAQLCGNGHASMAQGFLVVRKPEGLRQVAGVQGRRRHQLRVTGSSRPVRTAMNASPQRPFPATLAIGLLLVAMTLALLFLLAQLQGAHRPASAGPAGLFGQVGDFTLTNQAGAAVSLADCADRSGWPTSSSPAAPGPVRG